MGEVNGNTHPRLSPLASADRREALLEELRALIAADDYHVDPSDVASAVLAELATYRPPTDE